MIRFWLAIAVVFAHMGPLYGFHMMDGRTAVQMFFVISGFYTALILSEKYPTGREGVLLFYGNRFLRIFPSYWLVLALSVIIGLLEVHWGGMFHTFGAVRSWIERASTLPADALAYMVLSNLFLFGMDWGYFLVIGQDGLAWSANSLVAGNGRLDFFAPVPQAWALGLECAVYVVAPFLFRARTAVIVAVIVGSLALRETALHYGATFDPWTYRLLPFEICFFLFGVLSYRIYRGVGTAALRPYALPGFLALLASVVLYKWSPGAVPAVLGFDPRAVQGFVLLTLLMPFVFAATKSNRLDKLLGDMSFPIYLIHVLLIPLIGSDTERQRSVVLLATLIASGLMIKVIEIPIDRFRQRRVAALA
ncbi:acyltransferase [Cupriavidus pauculus]|uniref:acyltransferase family protein n=1 Tax=Cupriavidus pauculus TaxID=82633 RepID=UPI0024B5320F|nr:acyltransferase [Cupriavidus pauculus]